jgi:hypothetical protein
MKLSLTTWNGQNINNGSPFYAAIQPGQLGNIAVNPVIVNRANDYPAISSTVKQPSVLVINVWIAAGQDINAKRELLKQYFFGDEQRHNIVANDTADSNKPYYRTGFPVRLVEENNAPGSFFITIQTEYPYWQLVTAATANWSITGTAQTAAVTNGGNLPIAPTFTITPTTTKSQGLKYRRWVAVKNNTTKTYTTPLDITNGGIDTATLVTGGKMQTSGDDFRVWLNGVFVDRWLDSMNGAATKCWSNMSLSAPQSGTIAAQLGSAGTTVTFSETRTNLAFLQFLKTAGNTTIKIGSEAIVFDPTNVDTINYQITSLSRGQKNTTAATHAAATTADYIEHELWLMYGDLTLDAPETNDDNKPIFDLDSTNAAWTYTNYYDSTANRPGAWKGGVKATRTKLSYVYTANYNAFANPSTSLGLAEVNSTDFTVGHETAVVEWIFSHPAGMTTVAYSGDKYNSSSWPGIVGFQYLQPNTAWFTMQAEDAPAVSYAWEAFGPHTVTLTGAPDTVRFVIDGVLSSTIDELALVQFDTLTASFSTSALPTITLGNEAAINFFDFKLTNSTTGEWIKVKTPCAVNTALTVDCANKKAYLSDGRSVPVTLSSERDAWLNLAAGANTLRWDDTGTVAVSVVTSHKDKVL